MSDLSMDLSFVLEGKRKRKVISYEEDDTELDDLLNSLSASREQNHDDVTEHEAIVVDEDVLDTSYGDIHSQCPTTRKRADKARKKSKKQKPFQPFPFFELTAELRNAIYEYALVDDKTFISWRMNQGRRTAFRDHRRAKFVFASSSASDDPAPEEIIDAIASDPEEHGACQDPPHVYVRKALQPALLRASRQTWDEAIGLLYRAKFVFDDARALHAFMVCIGPRNQPFLRDITIGINGGYCQYKQSMYPALSAMLNCTNLTSLHFDCEYTTRRWMYPQQMAAAVYRDCSEFMRAYGRAHQRFDAALDIMHLNDVNFQSMEVWRHWHSAAKVSPEKVLERRRLLDDALRHMLSSA